MLYEDVNYDYFDYVVEKKQPSKICFGSGLHRSTIFAPKKYQKMPGPWSYDVKKYTKKCSKKGTPGISDLAERNTGTVTSTTPGPGRYSAPFFENVAEWKYAFNSTGKAKDIIKPKEGPGPTTYNAHKVKLCRRTRFDYNFGCPKMVKCVEMVCINYPTEKCEKCGNPFEFGDHWHKNYTTFLCTPCMDEEHRLHELYTEKELLQFKKIRTCFFMHRHEGTSAKIKLMSQRDIKKKLRVENYLSQYMQCYGTKSKTELVLPLNDSM